MQKNSILALEILVLVLDFSTTAHAATNSALAVLAQDRLVSFTGNERISQPFTFQSDVSVTNPVLNFASLARKFGSKANVSQSDTPGDNEDGLFSWWGEHLDFTGW